MKVGFLSSWGEGGGEMGLKIWALLGFKNSKKQEEGNLHVPATSPPLDLSLSSIIYTVMSFHHIISLMQKNIDHNNRVLFVTQWWRVFDWSRVKQFVFLLNQTVFLYSYWLSFSSPVKLQHWIIFQPSCVCCWHKINIPTPFCFSMLRVCPGQISWQFANSTYSNLFVSLKKKNSTKVALSRYCVTLGIKNKTINMQDFLGGTSLLQSTTETCHIYMCTRYWSSMKTAVDGKHLPVIMHHYLVK